MATDERPGDRHLHKAIGYRPPQDIRPALEARMAETGRGASAIITEALRRFLAEAGANGAAGE